MLHQGGAVTVGNLAKRQMKVKGKIYRLRIYGARPSLRRRGMPRIARATQRVAASWLERGVGGGRTEDIDGRSAGLRRARGRVS